MTFSRKTLGIAFGLVAAVAIPAGIKLTSMVSEAYGAVDGLPKSEQQYVIETGAKGHCDMLRTDLQPACNAVQEAYRIKW